MCQFSIIELRGKGHKPSLAENHSAQAMARASLARTHHYLFGIKLFDYSCVNIFFNVNSVQSSKKYLLWKSNILTPL